MFRYCRSPEELKILYRRLSKKLHPDMGGESDLFSLLSRAYESSIASGMFIKDTPSQKSSKTYRMRSEDTVSPEEASDLMDKIYKYAETHPKFSTRFIESVEEFMEENGYVTSGQYNSLVKVYYSFKMEKENDNKG